MKRGGLGEGVYLLYALLVFGMVAVAFSNIACEKAQEHSALNLAPEGALLLREDTEVFIDLLSPDMSFNPCSNQPHEIQLNWGESNLTVDWGNKNCIYMEISGFRIFGDTRDVIIGFRSDGVVVWRFKKGK